MNAQRDLFSETTVSDIIGRGQALADELLYLPEASRVETLNAIRTALP
jgi:hypothetical protein